MCSIAVAIIRRNYPKRVKQCFIIHRLSTIMSAFIDAAWGVHPAQLSKRSRGKKSLCEPIQCAKIGTNPKQNDAKGPAASLTEE